MINGACYAVIKVRSKVQQQQRMHVNSEQLADCESSQSPNRI